MNNIDSYKKECRNRVLKGFTIDNMVEKMDYEITKVKQNPSIQKIKNGQGLSNNLEIVRELVAQYMLESQNEYRWMANKFTCDNVHVILKYDKKAKKEQFYEQTLGYKIKHPIVVLLRKIGVYDKIKQIIGWEKH